MNRGIRLGIIVLFTFLGHIGLAYFTERTESLKIFGLFGALFLFYMLLVQEQWSSKELKWLIAGSIALRLVWVFSMPQLSDDWARFVWDGRLSAAGINPFVYRPSELITGELSGSGVADNSLYNALNSQHYFTVYPPFLQGMFAFASWLFPHSIYWNVVALKLFIFLAEGGSIWLIIRFCIGWNLAPKRVLLYALNPLVLAELCGNVHHEGIVLFFLLAVIFCLDKLKKTQNQSGQTIIGPCMKWFWLAAIFFSFCVDTKLLPLVVAPLIFVWIGFRRGLLFFTSAALLFLLSWYPFVTKQLIQHAGSSVALYFNHFEFNGSLYFLFSKLLVPYQYKESVAPLLGLSGGIIILIYSFKMRKNLNVVSFAKHFCVILGIYFAFAAVVHPWYIIPLIGLSTLSNWRFPIVWSVMIVGSYFTYRTFPYQVSNLQLVIEYTVLIVAVFWDLTRTHTERKKKIELKDLLNKA